MKKIYGILGLTILFCSLGLKLYIDHIESEYNYANIVGKPDVPQIDESEYEKSGEGIPGYPINVEIKDHSYDKKYLYSDGYDFDSAASACAENFKEYGTQENISCDVLYENGEAIGFEFRYTGDQTTN